MKVVTNHKKIKRRSKKKEWCLYVKSLACLIGKAKGVELISIRDIKTNPKKFWKYINQRTKTSSGIADLEDIATGRLTSNEKEKAEILATFFTSVFTQERTQEMPKIQKGKFKEEISHCIINREDVQKKLKSLNPNKSLGPDRLHPRILKELHSVLDKPLAILYQNTLKQGKIPDEWKHAIVTAIFKKGDKRKPNNYRPVSLTCIICKIIESIVRDKIMDHMKNNNLFSNKQFGFLDGRSTVLQLLTVLDKWTKIIDEGGKIDCVYFDFKKAFDKVPHQRLIYKAEQYGIKGEIINWIKSFLNSRTQQVVINGESSECKDVTSGIPQGSVLGPLLFVIFINDLPDQVKSDMYLFADDTKVFRRISTKEDKEILQEDINEMLKWADKWQLEFHPDKCVKMSINNKECENRTYKMNDITLKNVKQEKDIGVIVDDQLKFEDHMYEKIKKANNMMGLIRRSFMHLDKEMFLNLYKALVRPHLEYANVIWHPTKMKDITAIENVQRRATKYLPSLKDLSYEERLQKLKLPTLRYRRLRGDLIETYKLMTGKYDYELVDFMPKQHDSSSSLPTRGHHLKLYRQRAEKNLRNNFLSL